MTSPYDPPPTDRSRHFLDVIAANTGFDGICRMNIFELQAALKRHGKVGADGLTDIERDAMRILWELAETRYPIVSYVELAEEMDLELDAVRALVRMLEHLGWVRVPFNPAEPIQVLRKPDMSHLDGEA